MAALPLWPDDPVDAIMRVMERAFDPQFGEAWNRRQVADALVLGTCRYGLIAADGAVAEHMDEQAPDSEAVGFFLARHALDDEELLLFAIDPAHRRGGLGGILLDHFCRGSAAIGMQRIFLEMRAGNPAARLYDSRGFRLVGKRPAYYRGADGARHDALTYQRILGPV
jgi:[ribosomal protein S18]-alanine N-acetyltransferase